MSSLLESLLIDRQVAHDCPHHKEVTWRVKEIILLPYPVCTVSCREFCFGGGMWRLSAGQHPLQTCNAVYTLQRVSAGEGWRPCGVTWQVGVKLEDGSIFRATSGRDSLLIPFSRWTAVGDGCVVTRDELIRMRHLMSPGGEVTVFCSLAIEGPSTQSSGIQTGNPGSSMDGLVSDMRELLRNGANSDVFIRVRDREFRAHRAILGARVPAFFAMFHHQMMEAITGRVLIQDCLPEVFQLFLDFIYTGSLQDGNDNHLVGLYCLADKYQMRSLKAECIHQIRSCLSAESVSDVLEMAAHFDDEDLMSDATLFFRRELKDVLRTDSFKQLMTRNPDLVSQLMLKAVDSSEELTPLGKGN